MQNDLRQEYARIGKERDQAGRIHDRERFWFWVRIAVTCWIWVIVGALIMAQGFRINAVVGPFYFPNLMDRAQLWVATGVYLGTAGAFVTLVWGWRTAAKRGYLD
jgi:hypothetical protein